MAAAKKTAAAVVAAAPLTEKALAPLVVGLAPPGEVAEGVDPPPLALSTHLDWSNDEAAVTRTTSAHW